MFRHMIVILADFYDADTHLRENGPSFRADAQTTADGRQGRLMDAPRSSLVVGSIVALGRDENG
jgi:hypothetical protein